MPDEIKADLMKTGRFTEAEAGMIAARGGVAYGFVSGLVERGIFPLQFARLGIHRPGIGGWALRVLAGGTGEMAEEEAHKAPIKMVFPIALLIFPSIMIILLGPAAMLLVASPLGGILGG